MHSLTIGAIYARLVDEVDLRRDGLPASLHGATYRTCVEHVLEACGFLFEARQFAARSGIFKALIDRPDVYVMPSAEPLRRWLRQLRACALFCTVYSTVHTGTEADKIVCQCQIYLILRTVLELLFQLVSQNKTYG